MTTSSRWVAAGRPNQRHGEPRGPDSDGPCRSHGSAIPGSTWRPGDKPEPDQHIGLKRLDGRDEFGVRYPKP